jgi:predicted enzyme related to lactoylglutathione lyase
LVLNGIRTVELRLMSSNARAGAIIFAADPQRLADFYAAVTDLPIRAADDAVVVLRSDTFELVIHRLAGEPPVSDPPVARLDGYIKPFFPVADLGVARDKAAAFGGRLQSADEEWSARGFRACEGIDPEGNVVQFRQDSADT